MTPASAEADAEPGPDRWPDLWPVRRALLSVSDKAGLGDLARALAGRGVELVSTGATAGALRAGGLAVTEVAALTGLPEMLGGRVKTLHPAVHAGLLARPGHGGDAAEMAAHGFRPIDLLVVSLYPFEAAAARGAPASEVIEEIDVGGPAMIRAAAKTHARVAVLTDPADYAGLLDEIGAHDGATRLAYRRGLAGAAFARTAAYDAAVAAWLGRDEPRRDGAAPPRRRVLAGVLRAPLRYGENPHQGAAFYATGEGGPSVATAAQVGGKELSYNNILDADAALALVAELPRDRSACAIVKHAGPCGAAVGTSPAEAYRRALAADPLSAFGGIVALNRPLDAETAEEVARVFTEVVVAPGADEAARAVLAQKPNLRLLLTEGLPNPAAPGLAWRQVGGGLLVQDRDTGALDPALARVATRRAPTAAEWDDLRFAWTLAKHARSNAIVLVRDGATLGIGAGQASRVDAVRLAVGKAEGQGGAAGAALASDAFFPFADGIEAAAVAGVAAVIQPGGSVRDAEAAAAADAAGMAMVMTAMRHFRH